MDRQIWGQVASDIRHKKYDLGAAKLLSPGVKAKCTTPAWSKTWIKVKNPKSPAATRAMDGTV